METPMPMSNAKEDLIALLEDLLLPNALDPEMKVFFLKNRAAACPKGFQGLGLRVAPRRTRKTRKVLS